MPTETFAFCRGVWADPAEELPCCPVTALWTAPCDWGPNASPGSRRSLACDAVFAFVAVEPAEELIACVTESLPGLPMRTETLVFCG